MYDEISTLMLTYIHAYARTYVCIQFVLSHDLKSSDGLLMYLIWAVHTYIQTYIQIDIHTSGSVMPKQDLILPSSRGSSHCLFCDSVPYFINTSMLPVSGALQLNTCKTHSMVCHHYHSTISKCLRDNVCGHDGRWHK